MTKKSLFVAVIDWLKADYTDIWDSTNQRLLLRDLLSQEYGQLTTEFAQNQAISGTLQKITMFDTDGDLYHSTVSHTDDLITVKKAGRYEIHFSASFECDAVKAITQTTQKDHQSKPKPMKSSKVKILTHF